MKLVMDRNLEFAQTGGKSLTLDLYRPQPSKDKIQLPLPVLVWLHGEEGWFVGKYPCPIASMVGNEYAVASIDYRSASDAKFPDSSRTARRRFAGCGPTRRSTISTRTTLGRGDGRTAAVWRSCWAPGAT